MLRLKTSSFFLISLFLFLLNNESECTVEPHKDHLYKHEHYTGSNEHDSRYDHDAFLGPDAEKFEQFPPEESKRKLKIIVTARIDTDKDGFVSEGELEAWIEKQRKAFMYEAVEKNIKKEDKDGDGKISWDEYKLEYFGEWNDDNLPKDHVSQTLNSMRTLLIDQLDDSTLPKKHSYFPLLYIAPLTRRQHDLH